MFTGIVEHVGSVVRADAAPQRRHGPTPAHALEVDLGPLAAGLDLGASVAVNGACLTLAALRGTVARFDVVPETWRRTTLAQLGPGQPVNLERALRFGDRIDGHFVQGHVDGVGTITEVETSAGEWKVWTQTGAELMAYIVPKGSIALDGTSLTVVDVAGERFSVALVPTTLERTVLAQRRPGDVVNIETDILGRLVARRMEGLPAREAAGGLTWDKLQEGGFVP